MCSDTNNATDDHAAAVEGGLQDSASVASSGSSDLARRRITAPTGGGGGGGGGGDLFSVSEYSMTENGSTSNKSDDAQSLPPLVRFDMLRMRSRFLEVLHHGMCVCVVCAH